MTEPMNPAEQIWCRDLDGTGSLHMCSQEQDGAIEFVPREDYDKMRQDAAHQCRERVKEWDRAEALSAQLAAVTAERDAAVARVGVMEKALKFYEGAWGYKTNKRYGGLEWFPTEKLLDDCRNMAREALTPTTDKEPKA